MNKIFERHLCSGFITYELQVVSYELWNAILENKFRSSEFIFTSFKFVLRIGKNITSCKLLFVSCEFLFTSCKSKEIIVTSCVLWVENLKVLFYEQPDGVYELPDGVYELLDGVYELPYGVYELPDGVYELPDGAYELKLKIINVQAESL